MQVLEADEELAAEEDPGLVRAVAYLRNLQRADFDATARKQLAEMDDLRAAHQLYQAGGLRRAEIEARLLAGESKSEIARKTAVTEASIVAYASNFLTSARRRTTGFLIA
jgi:hypothetical protein